MSMLCRPKAFEGDKIWTNWEEAAVFCSGTDRRYHLRVKLDENPQPASDGPDFSMFGPAVRGTASLPNTWDRSNSSEHDPDFTRHCDIPIAATPTHSLCSEFDSEINVNQNAGSGLACWCGTSPISVVSVDGVLLNRSCPEHPCWDQTRRVISVETVWDKRCPARSTYNLFDIVNQSGLYYRHRPELIPVIRGSGEYFAMLFEDTKRQANEAERERLHDQQFWDNLGGDPESAGFTRQGPFPFMKFPLELRRNVYKHVFPGDGELICTWPSPAPLPFTEDIDEDACTDPLEWGTPEEYQDLDGFDETEDFYLPSNLLVGVELLAVNKQINDEASTVLYQNRRFRFNSHQLTRLLTNRNLFDQLCHIQLEDFAHNRFLNLVPIVKALLGGQRVKDITIGKNTANLFLHWTSQSLGKCESGWKAQGQVSDFEGYYDATIRLRVGALPKLSFYNFTKLREWNKVDGYFHKYAGYASRPEVVVELEEGMCHQLGAGLIDKTR